ncbi:MAG: restriction endonuclease subunit S [Armatimonadetes bacterium]|nr:restriction endonuclease subunit S [Armatimonadota bacterium]
MSSREREQRRGKYPYYGAAGIIDYVDQPIFSGLYLLVGEDGSVVKEDGSPFLQLASGEFWVNNHAHVLQGEDDIETRYLYYALSATNIRPFVTGAVQPKLSQGNMNRVPIPYPDRDGREAIVAALGSLDDKIEQNRRTSEALERLAQATFKAWFVDFEPVRAKATGAKSFPGMPPETFAALPTTFTSSPLGPIPEGWEVRSIGDLVTVKGGATPSTKEPDFWENGTHCWVTPKDLSGLRDPVLLGTERRITNIGAAQISSGVLPLDTVLLSSRAPIGYTALAKVPTAINQGFIALVCDGLLPPLYVFHWVRFAMEDIKGRASGTTFPEISKAAFRPIPTVVPSAKLLAAFEGRCEPLFDLVTAIVQESVKLAELRDYLLPRLLSGSVRVGDDSNG